MAVHAKGHLGRAARNVLPPHTWVDNCLVAPDRSIFTVLEGGILEIRGPGWDRRRRGDPPGADRPRVCKLGTVARARRIAEMVADRL